jgi:hypothetical protein
MMWLIYDNADEHTQVFMGSVIIIASFALLIGSFYFWAKDKISKEK